MEFCNIITGDEHLTQPVCWCLRLRVGVLHLRDSVIDRQVHKHTSSLTGEKEQCVTQIGCQKKKKHLQTRTHYMSVFLTE